MRPPASSRLAPDVFLVPPRSARDMVGPASSVLLVLTATAAVLSVVGLATGWWRVLPVLSPSMRPAFDAGSAMVAT
ncbi:MAG TPA: hypothetical protein VK942_18420, partial [Actinomycetes bacterium]|nr:hypothetical protein [Actinomycetes bacterium]